MSEDFGDSTSRTSSRLCERPGVGTVFGRVYQACRLKLVEAWASSTTLGILGGWTSNLERGTLHPVES
jgi:hypothetical protein